MGAYATALKDLGSRVLGCISQGIGLEKDYFACELSEDNILTVNHYPPSPNPSLTLGLTKHTDPNLITILQAVPVEVPGLELIKEEKWLSFGTAPDAFMVFVGNQLEVISLLKLTIRLIRSCSCLISLSNFKSFILVLC